MYRKMFSMFSLVLVLAVVFTAVLPVAAQPSLKSKGGILEESPNGVYIVQMLDNPVVAYNGGINGLKATKPKNGEKIDPNSPAVVNYVAYLDSKHNDAVSRAGGQKLYDYRYSFNGFAAQMSLAEANKIAGMDGVLNVSPDSLQTMDTSSTPTFLGLNAPGGLWDQLGGPNGGKNGVGGAGDGIIIGVIDSGIWPESLSFSDRDANGKLVYQQISGFHGKCDSAEIIIDGSWDANLCNKKLVAAQHFNAAWGGDAAIQDQRPWEFLSPRDYNSHGTHTSSTAGGNFGVQATGPASVFGTISGMAPRARVAMYKALWSTQDGSTASGFTADLVEAIDTAVADGVDVINYSISGTTTNFLDPVQVSYLFAADAGVFVAASAGNSGPTIGTVAHPGPWLTTVAAGTHNRNGEGSVTLGNGATYFGASVATAVGPAPLINAEDAIATPVPDDPTTAFLESALCVSGTLDPAKTAGKIVVCDRGVNARVDKSLAVQMAGGVGMILVNATANSLNADFHFVPTVHLQNTDRAAVKAYAATADATATINQATIVYNVAAPFTAAFSSRGPLTAGGGDLLKPDVIAPGQDILASVSPAINGRDFDLLSGTSMSSPHVAGLAALLKDLHPNWTPMMIKSALMTSASDILDGPNTNPLVIFRQGAGHVRPNNAANPGLVYNSGFNDWLAFLCGTTNGVNPASCAALVGAGYSTDPSNLNVASIAIGDLPGVQTVTRKVTNVGGSSATYNVSLSGLAGVTAVVTPSSLTLGPGETKSYTVAFTRTTAALNAYVGGQLTWSDGVHSVRSPVVVRPVALGAPASVSSNGSPINYNVLFGYTGTFTATARGLVPATTFVSSVADDPGDSFTRGGPGTVSFTVAVPAGATYTRFSLFNANVSPASDLDLYVFNAANQLVATSGGGTSDEEANLLNPAAGTYTVWVHGFAVTGTANFTLFTWVLDSTDAGNMVVTAPAAATLGTSGTINLTFSGLTPGTKYLGSVAYSGVAGLPNPTIVRVNP
jgi:subtilisin family serine protease